jgi:Fur family ferric uptake transcriptional regulator
MNIASSIRKSGLKATLPRLKILEIFEQNREKHLSAEDIYKILLRENVEIGLATVYRVLTQFEEASILIKHHFETGKAVFELNEGSHHDHLVCLDCGKVEEFYNENIENLQNQVATNLGFNIEDHSLKLYVRCKKKRCNK